MNDQLTQMEIKYLIETLQDELDSLNPVTNNKVANRIIKKLERMLPIK